MKRLLSFALLFSLLIFQSCSESSQSPSAEGVEPTPVEFSNGVITRASGVNWAKDDRVGIYMLLNGTTTSYEYDDVTYANIQYYNELTSGTAANFAPVNIDEEIYYTMDNEAVDFVAVYPYSDQLTATNFIYPLDMSDQSEKTELDLMTAYVTNANTSLDAVELTFSHLLSQLTFVVKAGDGYPSLNGLTISISGLINSGTYDVMNKSLELGDTTSNLSVLNEYAIILPQTAKVVFHIATTDCPEGFDTDEVSVTFESGKSTEVTLTLNRGDVNFDGDSIINGWIDSPDLGFDAEQVVAFAAVVSRAGDQTTTENLYTSSYPNIGIFMFDDTTESVVNGVANIEHAADDDGAFSVVDTDETIYYPQGFEYVDFVAYSPYGTKVGSDDFSYEVAVGEDFMLADKLDDKIISDEIQTFTFNHMMSQIVVNVSAGIGSPSLDGLEILIDGLLLAGACDIRADAPSITASGSATQLSVARSTESIIVPQTALVTFTVKTDDNTVGFSTSALSFTFNSGETTTVSLKVNLSDVDFSGASTITPWVPITYKGGDTVNLF